MRRPPLPESSRIRRPHKLRSILGPQEPSWLFSSQCLFVGLIRDSPHSGMRQAKTATASSVALAAFAH